MIWVAAGVAPAALFSPLPITPEKTGCETASVIECGTGEAYSSVFGRLNGRGIEVGLGGHVDSHGGAGV